MNKLLIWAIGQILAAGYIIFYRILFEAVPIEISPTEITALGLVISIYIYIKK